MSAEVESTWAAGQRRSGIIRHSLCEQNGFTCEFIVQGHLYGKTWAVQCEHDHKWNFLEKWGSRCVEDAAPSPPPTKPAGKEPSIGDVWRRDYGNPPQFELAQVDSIVPPRWRFIGGTGSSIGYVCTKDPRGGIESQWTFIRSATDVTEGAAATATAGPGECIPGRGQPPPPSPPLVIPGPCGLITRSGLPCGLVEKHKGRPCEVLPDGERPRPAGVSAGELRELAAGPWRRRRS